LIFTLWTHHAFLPFNVAVDFTQKQISLRAKIAPNGVGR
jgi:hypothetical protein